MSTLSAPTPSATRIDPRYLRAKRILDILFTSLLLVPLCIVMVIVAGLIRLDSKGPIFFRQKRAGLHGVEFDMFKFLQCICIVMTQLIAKPSNST